mmetsp:Transcript_1757/g.2579  ORF Transcript_1757/g.2579 Transcript_1757/m.2579 type:complete len:112 (+) Transcript_1757:1381-1716(+)
MNRLVILSVRRVTRMSSGVMIKGKGIMQTWWIQCAIWLDAGKYTNPGAVVREPPPCDNVPNDTNIQSSSRDGLYYCYPTAVVIVLHRTTLVDNCNRRRNNQEEEDEEANDE